MTVKIDDIMNSINAEDFEQPFIESVLLPQAQAYARLLSNRKYEDLTEDEKQTFDHTVMMLVADWYSHPDGGGKNAGSTKYTGFNLVMDALRAPGFESPTPDTSITGGTINGII